MTDYTEPSIEPTDHVKPPIEPIAVVRLSRDLREMSGRLSQDEARYLVDAYYLIQEQRIRADNQVRALTESGEAASVISWLAQQSRTLENQVKAALDRYSANHAVGEWLRGVKGIGPVLAAGLLAHIDIEKAPTAGHIMSFAGLDPTKTWGKGERRPWNATLKTLCWKIGESFVKISGDEASPYGQLYIQRKAEEIKNNEAGKYADQAKRVLEQKRIGKDTEAFKAYSVGKLPPAHIHARAKRWVVKIFLSHLHEVWYRLHYGKPAPSPYPLAHLGHAHKIEPDPSIEHDG